MFHDIHVPLQMKGEESAFYREAMTDSCWRSVLAHVKYGMDRMDRQLSRRLAGEIAQAIQWLHDPMERYCRATCFDCEDPCCLGREIFYNETDLIYLSALEEGIPPGQTRSRTHEPCRYLGQSGCRLPRTRRPYVCVWFLCDAQMKIFQEESASYQRQFIRTLQEVRQNRLLLESLYLSQFQMVEKTRTGPFLSQQ